MLVRRVQKLRKKEENVFRLGASGRMEARIEALWKPKASSPLRAANPVPVPSCARREFTWIYHKIGRVLVFC